MRLHFAHLTLLSASLACSTLVEELGASVLNLHPLFDPFTSACGLGPARPGTSDTFAREVAKAEFTASFELQRHAALIRQLSAGARSGTIYAWVARGLYGGGSPPPSGSTVPGSFGANLGSPSTEWGEGSFSATTVTARADRLELELELTMPCGGEGCTPTIVRGRAIATPERSTLILGEDALTWNEEFVALREGSGLLSVFAGCDEDTGDGFVGRIVAEAGEAGEPELTTALTCWDAAQTIVSCAGLALPTGI